MKSADQGVQWSGAAPASHSCACKFAQYFDGWERCLVSNCAVPTCRQERQRVCNRGSNNYHCCMNYHLNVQYKRADAWLVLRAVHAAGESGGRQWRGHAAAQGSQQWRRGHRVGGTLCGAPAPRAAPAHAAPCSCCLQGVSQCWGGGVCMRGPLFSCPAGRGSAGRQGKRRPRGVCRRSASAAASYGTKGARGLRLHPALRPAAEACGPAVAQGRQACGSGGCID